MPIIPPRHIVVTIDRHEQDWPKPHLLYVVGPDQFLAFDAAVNHSTAAGRAVAKSRWYTQRLYFQRFPDGAYDYEDATAWWITRVDVDGQEQPLHEGCPEESQRLAVENELACFAETGALALNRSPAEWWPGALRDAASARAVAKGGFEHAITAAREAGVPVIEIAAQSGLSRRAVYDILERQPSAP